MSDITWLMTNLRADGVRGAVTAKAMQLALQEAALIADQVEATARPGDGKETAAEIGRRIRAMMEEGR